jgi:O-antigen ligase
MVNTRKLFMHSGLLHVLFKLGLIGFFLFVAILFKYGAGWLAVRRKLQGDSQEYIIGEASFAAFIFTIPDLLNGTPFIVFRVAQMYALMLGITWVASSLAPVRSN